MTKPCLYPRTRPAHARSRFRAVREPFGGDGSGHSARAIRGFSMTRPCLCLRTRPGHARNRFPAVRERFG